ncbi:MAG: DUF4982 domain-containing protein [Muribaculaceae bacterium]|nr:DUF4982 domain-containing protein [Muribaculaceae bacterium]
MKPYYLRRLMTAITAAVALTAAAQLSTGTAELLNDGWKFSLKEADGAEAPGHDDSEWQTVRLPHDWSIGLLPSPSLNSCTGFFPGGMGWYRKHFTVTDLQPVRYLLFEGVYNRSEVFVNGRKVGSRPNGYVSFYYDISPYLKTGDNVVAVKVDHTREADSRWYTGSGIYRDVYLITANETHFTPWGLEWQAEKITTGRATVNVGFSTEGDAKKQMKVKVILADSSGRTVATGNATTSVGRKGSVKLTVRNPEMWSVDTPALYTLRAELLDNGKVADAAECRVGLRTLGFDADKGFTLNGVNMKVKGVCLHHDAGVLGAAVPREVWRRRLENLKELGVNAIRMSHNPQAPVVYDLCDELGFLVMDEASDEWEFPKRKWVSGWNVGTPKFEGSHDFFEEWIERDVADMVRRDRNHPCIAFWSIGNEVDYPNDPYSHPVLDHAEGINQPNFGGYDPEAPSAMRIGEIAKRLAATVREIDRSRPVTGALAGVVMSNQTAYPEAVDIVGYNYTENRYHTDHETYPDRIIYGSENGHGYDAWLAVKENDFIFGQFLWTGTDYLGESGVWPSRGLGTGLLDFGGFMKSRGKFRASLWRDDAVAYLGAYPVRGDRDPGFHIDAQEVWNYDDGQPMRVVCYTNCPAARLKLGDRVIGTATEADRRNGMLWWDMAFAPGELTVEALDADGKVAATDTLRTTGRPYALRATVEKMCDGERIAHVTVEVTDENGLRVPLADNMIRCRVEGGTLLGLEGTGNHDMSHPRSHERRVCNGRALAYIEKGSGPVKVTFTSPLLKTAVARL